MYPNSYYTATAPLLPEQPPLQESVRADVCVIGAGYTGLSAALYLARAGMQVVLLEAQRIGWGASGRNGGQLSGGQRQDVDWLEKHFGAAGARRLWELGEDAKRIVKQLIEDLGIECDLTRGVAVVAHRRRYVGEYHALADKLTCDYGRTGLEKIDAEAARALLGTAAYHGGYVDWEAAHLHPLKLALGLATHCIRAGVRIFEGSRALRFDDGAGVTVQTAAGRVQADYLVLAANGYLGNLAPKLAGRIMPINNFMIATESLDVELAASLNPRRIAAADSRFVVNYFRLSTDRRMLFGGGENYRRHFPQDIAAFVRPYLLKIYPQLAAAKIDYAWGGTLAITLNRLPHFGQLSRRVFFAQGYSGQGVGLAHLAGAVIAEAIRGTTGRFDVLRRIPTRMFPGGRWLRWPGLVLGMTYFALRDRLP